MVINYYNCIGNIELIDLLNKDGYKCQFITKKVSSEYCESYCFGKGCKDYNWDKKICNLILNGGKTKNGM